MSVTRSHTAQKIVNAVVAGARQVASDDRWTPPAGNDVAVDRAYRADRRQLHAARVRPTYTIFLLFGALATGLEFISYPERRVVMLAAYAVYVGICVATIAAVKRRPQWATAVAVAANNALILCTAAYYVRIGGSPEACALTLVLFLAALPLLNAAGAAVQALSSLGALVGFSLVLLAGVGPELPVSYGVTAILGAVAVTVLGAHLLDRGRRAAFVNREALRANEARTRAISERYRALYENNPAMYFTVEADGAVRSVNRFGAEQLGYGAAELVGRSVLSVCCPDDRDRLQAQLESCLDRPGEVARAEFRTVRKDGSVQWVRASARALREGDGRLIVLIVCEDVTERKQAEDALRRHQAELAHVGRVSLMGEMAAGLAHELNQPLAAIVNFTRGCERRLRLGGAANVEILDALDQASTQALRAGEIIRRIRDFIRKEEPSLARVDLNELVRNVAMLADLDARLHGIRIDLALAPAIPKVYVDSIQIEQVILNLIRNGFDAMAGHPPAERTLSIRTSAREGSEVDVAISDSGTGLTPDVLEHIFDPFFSTKPSGLGLGLSISRSIIEAHGGRLCVESRAGSGSTFRFSLGCAHDEGS
jgi:PAS domain S-box-containing protein